MTVNKKIDTQEYKQTLASILPVQFEPGSLADRLLIQGREEGREEGRKEGSIEARTNWHDSSVCKNCLATHLCRRSVPRL